jgi:hypothetical protein
MSRSRCPTIAVLCIGMASMGGCGRPVTTVPVSGTVEMAGTDLAGLTVVFYPIRENPKEDVDKIVRRSANGLIGSEGEFALETVYDRKLMQGAQPGHYKVAITASERAGTANYMALMKQIEAVPVQYRSEATTPLKVEVPDEGATDLGLVIPAGSSATGSPATGTTASMSQK